MLSPTMNPVYDTNPLLVQAAAINQPQQQPIISDGSGLENSLGRGDGPDGACLTCEARRYQDVSTDSGVSFQSPTYISPEQSFAAVRGHEMEHIRRDRASAEAQGDEVVYQQVSFSVADCPECGKMYKSGGTATTVTRSASYDDSERAGFDMYA